MKSKLKEIKKETQPENKCNCQPLPKWVKYLALVLIIATFIIACFLLHHLWKLSDIWQALKNSK